LAHNSIFSKNIGHDCGNTNFFYISKESQCTGFGEKLVKFENAIKKVLKTHFGMSVWLFPPKEGLIKFQAYIEGGTILAITDHAALTCSKTFQNVN